MYLLIHFFSDSEKSSPPYGTLKKIPRYTTEYKWLLTEEAIYSENIETRCLIAINAIRKSNGRKPVLNIH